MKGRRILMKPILICLECKIASKLLAELVASLVESKVIKSSRYMTTGLEQPRDL